ncbi:NAC domain-containing protein 54 [Linum grandiflorum]
MPPLELDHHHQQQQSSDLLQEILSVAHASQDLINNNNDQQQYSFQAGLFGDDFAADVSDFTFTSSGNREMSMGSSNDVRSDSSWIDHHPSSSRSVEIGGEGVGDCRMVENLRWLGMSNDELNKSFMEEHKIVPMSSISILATHNQNHNNIGLSESDQQDNVDGSFYGSLVFTDDHPSTTNITAVDVAAAATSPSFDDVAAAEHEEEEQEVKVNHGMFVATRQAANTFFHQLVPSQTVKIQLNRPAAAAEKLIMIGDNYRNAIDVVSLFVMALLTSHGKKVQIAAAKDSSSSSSTLINIRRRRGGRRKKKFGVFLTVSLALCYTMLVNRIM